mmetsp:Transcript_57472/g.147791  ORF Transcript_57472/g.147791 Transcript_57472/m.147791 type:complete len:231 (-) Transcript_57472:257-949(-)
MRGECGSKLPSREKKRDASHVEGPPGAHHSLVDLSAGPHVPAGAQQQAVEPRGAVRRHDPVTTHRHAVKPAAGLSTFRVPPPAEVRVAQAAPPIQVRRGAQLPGGLAPGPALWLRQALAALAREARLAVRDQAGHVESRRGLPQAAASWRLHVRIGGVRREHHHAAGDVEHRVDDQEEEEEAKAEAIVLAPLALLLLSRPGPLEHVVEPEEEVAVHPPSDKGSRPSAPSC